MPEAFTVISIFTTSLFSMNAQSSTAMIITSEGGLQVFTASSNSYTINVKLLLLSYQKHAY